VKSRVPPLALGGALALCLIVLLFAVRTFTAHEEPRWPGAEDEGATAASGSVAPVSGQDAGTLGLAPADEGSAARVAISGGGPALPQAEYELRASDARPLRGVSAGLRRGAEFLGAGRSNDAGVVSFDAGEGLAELVLVARDAAPTWREVPRSEGRHVIVLERGVAVSGRVRVQASMPIADIELELTSDRPMIDDSGWPAELREALELRDRDKLRLAVRTNEAGQFEFTGLPMPWSGRLTVGQTHELMDVSGVAWSTGSMSVRLDDPIEGLLLDLTAVPMATGRVVAAAGGEGIARASISGALVFVPPPDHEEAPTAAFDGRTREDGRFAIPIQRRENFNLIDWNSPGTRLVLRSATLTIDGGDEVPRRRLEISGSQLPSPFDFGELVLERGATLHFVAVDSAGAPLTGAIGRLDGERSERTDEHGRATIAYAPGVGRPLVVQLDGYRDGRAEIPAEVSDALSVKLERTTRLSVLVKDPAGAPASGLNVNVRFQAPNAEGGNNRRGGRPRDARTDEEGKAEFSDLPAGVLLRVGVRDAMGAIVAEQQLTLEESQWRSLELSMPQALLAFAGVVRDEQGLPLAEARVEFQQGAQGRQQSVSENSDADGSFAFAGLSQPAGTLRVRKIGFAPLTVSDFQIPPRGTPVELRLERGLRIVLRIVDERGTLVRGDNLRLELAGERAFTGRRDGNSEWSFSNLPRVSLVAIANVGSREYRQEIEPLNGDQDFRVPVHGGLEVELRLAPELTQKPLRLTLRARDDRRVVLTQGLAKEPLQTRRFVPLLPGDYQLNLVELVNKGNGNEWSNVGAVQRLKIQPGETLRLELER